MKCCDIYGVLLPWPKNLPCYVDVRSAAHEKEQLAAAPAEEEEAPTPAAMLDLGSVTDDAAPLLNGSWPGMNQVCQQANLICAAGSTCCGHACMPQGSVCCENEIGTKFQCGMGSSCCGNACAAPGNTCCNENSEHYKYPVAIGSPCMRTCRHLNYTFACGAESSCCGPICVGAGGSCCRNDGGYYFACGQGSRCCGGFCSAPGSDCLGHKA